MSKWESNEEIKIFQEYLRIPTVHPDIDYEPCIAFLKKQAESLGLPVKIYYPGGPTKPILVMTWVGTQPELPSIVLNSHTDVVPVFPENWTHPPFGAEIDAEGKIYARGAQDMKCVGMQYLAAIRALKKDGVTLKRTIHIVYVPDEEIGGKLGMKLFVETEDFKALNVGMSLDEGAPWPKEVSPIYYGERSTWQIHLKFHGQAGHGSIIHPNTAAEKFHYVISKFLEYREREKERLKSAKHIGDVTTVNLTKVLGGVQTNVVPSLLEAWFDCRVAVDVDMQKYEEMIEKWAKEAGENVEIIWDRKDPIVPATCIDDSNKFWGAIKRSFEELNVEVDPQICPGGTDSKYLRSVGIPAFGYSPMPNTKILLHGHDEYLGAETYLRGIEIYTKLITNVANVE